MPGNALPTDVLGWIPSVSLATGKLMPDWPFARALRRDIGSFRDQAAESRHGPQFPVTPSFVHNRGLRHDEQIRSVTALSVAHMQDEIARLFALMRETADFGGADLADINACATDGDNAREE